MADTTPADETPATPEPSTEVAGAAPTAQTEHLVAETPAPVVATAAPKRGKKIALIAVGAVVAAGLLFGGGVAVGLAIPTGGPGFSQNGGPGGGTPPGMQDGERPTMPGQGTDQGGTDSGSTDDTQTEEG
jgi:hypothetical protein